MQVEAGTRKTTEQTLNTPKNQHKQQS